MNKADVIGPMCLFVLLSAQQLFAQSNPNGVIPLSTIDQPYVFLVRDPEVHKDLELTPDQQKKLQAINDEVDLAMWAMRNKGPQTINKVTYESATKTRQKLATVLTKEQIDRIGQIEIWVLGMKALLRDDVAEKMKLDSDQRSKIRSIILATRKQTTELRQQLNNGGDAASLNEKFRAAQEAERDDIIALVSDEQKQIWAGLLGKPINPNKLGRVRLKAPDLIQAAGWVNSEPLTLDKLKGKVVALHFYAFA